MENKLSDMIKKYRFENSLSQKEFANLVGISYVQINNIENERHKPSMKTFSKLASFLSIKYEDIKKD